jgi:hypothetical protein
MSNVNAAFALLVPIVGAIALFTFLAIAAWSEERRKEREAFYRMELLKKLAEQPSANTETILAMMHQEEKGHRRRRREGLILGGGVTAAVGAGLLLFLGDLAGPEVARVGWIPLLIGLVLLLYGLFLAPKDDAGEAKPAS